MTMRLWRALTFLTLVSLFWEAAAFPSVREPASNKITKITITADGELDVSDLRDSLVVKIGDPFDSTGIQESIARLYRTGDFHYIECTSQVFEDGIWLDFRLVLQRYFARFHLQAPRQLRSLENSLARYFPLGESYSEAKEQRFVVEVEKFLHNRGYFPVEISPRTDFDPQGRSANVILAVQIAKPTVLRKIALGGEMTLSENLVRKALKLKPGDSYSRESLITAVERLKRLYVRHSYLAPKIIIDNIEPVPETNQVDLLLSVHSGTVVEVLLENVRVSKGKLQELLPIYREASLDNDLLEEGRESLHDYFLSQGYSSADITFSVQQERASQKTRLLYQAKLGQKLLVENVRVEGLQALSRAEFQSSLAGPGPGIRTGKYFTLLGFETACKRVLEGYRKRGLLDAAFVHKEITISEGGTVDLDFRIQEGTACAVRNILFRGNSRIHSDELLVQVGTKVERPFSEQQLELDKKALQEFYLDRGYPKSSVQALHGRVGSAIDITFQVEEGPQLTVKHLAIVGNERTKLSAISRNLGFRLNDGMIVKKLFEGEQKLYNTAAFDQVRIRPADPQLKETHQTVIVGVRETPPRLLDFGIGYQEFEGPRGLFEISYLNVGGSLRTAQVRFKGSLVNQSVQLNLREPRPLNRNLESFATLQASRKEEVSFTEHRFGASLQALRELNRTNALIFRYNYEHVDVFNAKVSLEEIPKVSRPLNLSSFSTALINDTRNNPFDPERGAFNSVNLQVTAPVLKSDAHFTKMFAQSQYYRPLGKGLFFAEAFRLGLAHNFTISRQLPISERFFAGGATTLRGFANDEAGPRDPVTDKPIGGNALFINNLELRFPLFSRIGGVLFYDTGNVFSEIASMRFSDLTHSAGLGLRVHTPIGPIRFDYGFNLNPVPGRAKQHFFISFGPLF